MLSFPQRDIFLSKDRDDTITIAVGSYLDKRRVYLTEDEARKLAYRLLSLAAGQGVSTELFVARTD